MNPVVNHVGQCVTDLERSRRFYCELLGFEVERELTIPDAAAGPLLRVDPPLGLTALYLRLDAFVLELMIFDRPENPAAADRVFNEPGLTHLSISVEDLADVVARVPDYGGAVLMNVPQVAMIRDPDGQLLELLPMEYRRRLDAQLAARAQD